MTRIIASFVAFLCSFLVLFSQPTRGLVAHYSFDNCDAVDVSLNNSDGVLFGSPGCDCGVEGNALKLNGQDDYVILAGNVENYFRRNTFTLSFYFRTTDVFGTHDILSKRENCSFERAFAVRYTPTSSTLSVDISESSGNRTSFIEQIDPSICWIHVVIVKKDGDHSIYINGEFLAQQPSAGNLDLETTAPFQIANSPCLGTTDRRFSGLIDEMRIYNRPLDNIEIRELYLKPDRIANSDTTIYQGGAVQVSSESTCATSFQWSPSAEVQDPGASTTVLTPEATQQFYLEYQYGSCTATDSILVKVIDPDDIECGELPIPSAFTPNQDGKNDTYFISNPFSLEELIMFDVYDRWGNRVFQTSNASQGWDGTYRGNDVNPGLYLFKIKYKCRGEELTKTGSVMLIR